MPGVISQNTIAQWFIDMNPVQKSLPYPYFTDVWLLPGTTHQRRWYRLRQHDRNHRSVQAKLHRRSIEEASLHTRTRNRLQEGQDRCGDSRQQRKQLRNDKQQWRERGRCCRGIDWIQFGRYGHRWQHRVLINVNPLIISQALTKPLYAHLSTILSRSQ